MDLPLPAENPPPLLLDLPAAQTVPLVVVSAHSGRHYPADLLASARLDSRALRRSEDCFVDELFAAAPALGAPLLRATVARAYCDMNREAWELDPDMFRDPLPAWVNTRSARVSAGLGTIARVVGTGEPIYRDKLAFADAEIRVRTLWQPFHDHLSQLVAQTLASFGACLIVDCHSMPASSLPAPRMTDVVLGDAHGTACAPTVTRAAEAALTGLGYRSRRNEPYAGGYITRHYGRPRDRVHALQVEIARDLYMDEATQSRRDRFDQVCRDMTAFLAALAGGTALQLVAA